MPGPNPNGRKAGAGSLGQGKVWTQFGDGKKGCGPVWGCVKETLRNRSGYSKKEGGSSSGGR